MKKWEYMLQILTDKETPGVPRAMELYNRMGEQGWEIISFVHHTDIRLFEVLLKRPLPAGKKPKPRKRP